MPNRRHNPTRIDGKCGHHFLQAHFSGLISEWRDWNTSGLPTIRELSRGGSNRDFECGCFYP